jgi:hypothetical protein
MSEHAVALMFDIVRQNGSIAPVTKSAILADFKRLSDQFPDEADRLRIVVANRRADAASKEYIDDVRTRKLTIANGAGVVHGLVYDLADAFCITLDRFALQAGAAST